MISDAKLRLLLVGSKGSSIGNSSSELSALGVNGSSGCGTLGGVCGIWLGVATVLDGTGRLGGVGDCDDFCEGGSCVGFGSFACRPKLLATAVFLGGAELAALSEGLSRSSQLESSEELESCPGTFTCCWHLGQTSRCPANCGDALNC